MEEKNKHILKKAISHLPQYSVAGGKIWERIDRSLEKKKKILSGLPEYKSPECIWERVAEDLDEKLPTKDHPERRYRSLAVRLAAAATILILVGLGIWQLTQKEHLQEEVSYTTENIMILDKTGLEMDEGTQHEINVLLSRHCKANPKICASLEYKDLQNELQEIDKACEELLHQIVKSPDNQLYQFLYRMENERMAIQKELLHLLNKS